MGGFGGFVAGAASGFLEGYSSGKRREAEQLRENNLLALKQQYRAEDRAADNVSRESQIRLSDELAGKRQIRQQAFELEDRENQRKLRAEERAEDRSARIRDKRFNQASRVAAAAQAKTAKGDKRDEKPPISMKDFIKLRTEGQIFDDAQQQSAAVDTAMAEYGQRFGNGSGLRTSDRAPVTPSAKAIAFLNTNDTPENRQMFADKYKVDAAQFLTTGKPTGGLGGVASTITPPKASAPAATESSGHITENFRSGLNKAVDEALQTPQGSLPQSLRRLAEKHGVELSKLRRLVKQIKSSPRRGR